MATQKRHVIYFSDEEWADVKARAKHQGVTASAYIRSAAIGGHVTPISLQRELASQSPTAQAQRDAILRRIAKG